MNINSNEYFLSTNNLEMLWELLTEESNYKIKPQNIRQNIYDVFYNNLATFNDTEKMKGENLINMNKKYVMSMINYINNLESKELENNTLINSFNKSNSNIDNAGVSGGYTGGGIIKNSQKYTPITAEDIKSHRQIIFENELVKHQRDFDKVIKKNIPKELNFKIDLDEGPIKEMDKKIKEITEQRNYDLQHINNSYGNNTNNSIQSNNTNVSNNNARNNTINKNNNSNTKITDDNVYIQIDNKDITMTNEDINIIKLDQTIENTIRTTTNMNGNNTNNNDIIGLFNKLKKVDKQHTTNSNREKIATNKHDIHKEELNSINGKIDTMRNDITSINDKIELLYNMITKIVTKDTQENTATSTDKDIP